MFGYDEVLNFTDNSVRSKNNDLKNLMVNFVYLIIYKKISTQNEI